MFSTAELQLPPASEILSTMDSAAPDPSCSTLKRPCEYLYEDMNAPSPKLQKLEQPVSSLFNITNCTSLVPVFPNIPSPLPLFKCPTTREGRKRRFGPETEPGFADEEDEKRMRASVFYCIRGLRRNEEAAVTRAQDIVKFEIGVLERMSIVMKSICDLGRPLPLPMHLISELLEISDDTFDGIMRNYAASLGPDNVNALIACAEGKLKEEKLVTHKLRKFATIIRFGMYPYFLSNDMINRLFVSYDKLMTIDKDLVIRNLHIQQILKEGCLMKQLYHKAEPREIFAILVEHMVDKNLSFKPHMLLSLGQLLEKETEFPKFPTSQFFITLIQDALESSSESFGGFFYSIVRKFINSMTEAEVRMMGDLNHYNSKIYQDPVDKLVQERLRLCEQAKLDTLYGCSQAHDGEQSFMIPASQPYSLTSTVSIQPLLTHQKYPEFVPQLQYQQDDEVEMENGE